jgi:DNA (cytosine-5)-methyltransferase 1
MVCDEIKSDLEAEGFEVIPPLVLPACAVGADHQRDRLWIIAHSTGERLEVLSKQHREANQNGGGGKAPNSFNAHPAVGRLFRLGEYKNIFRGHGLSPNLDGIAFSKWRNESIKAGGNAIVPQVAYEIFKAIKLFNDAA